MIFENSPGDGLQQHGFTGSRGCHDQPALSLPNRSDEIHHPRAVLFAIKFEVDAFFRIERSQIVEQDFVASDFRILIVDLFDFEKRKVPLAFLRRPDLTGYDIASTEIESADLRGRNVDIVRTGEIVGVRSAKKSEPVR